MSNVNNASNINTPSTPNAPSRKISPILIGGIVLALIGGIGNLTGNAARGHQANQPSMASPYSGDRSSENDSTEQNGGDMAAQASNENGYAPQDNSYTAPSYQSPGYPAPTYQAPSTGDDATDNGYAAREKAQDQSAQAFDNYIRDTDTVRDTENGQVYTDVPNAQADSAIQSGAATEVPTAELPTSGDSGAASTPDTSASDAPAAE